MSLDEINSVRANYINKDKKLENKLLNEKLDNNEFKMVEEKQILIENTIDLLDDLIDAYADEDVDDINILQEQLEECMEK